jgi:short subunit dehydrogenase-like uncharacterized protein
MSTHSERVAAFESIGRNADAIADLSRLLSLAQRKPSRITKAKQIEIAVELACRVAALARDTDNLIGSAGVYE